MKKIDEYLRWNMDGTQQHVIVTADSRELTQELLKQIGNKVVRRTGNAFKVAGNGVTLYCTEKELYAAMFLPSITIRSAYEMDGYKILSPKFIHKDQKEEKLKLMVFNGVWQVPQDMRLMFAARIKNHSTNKPYTHYDHHCFLYAWDAAGRAWRLPLPNIYGNCDICMGEFNGVGNSTQEAFQKAYDQFEGSEWNTDLLESQGAAESLFRFKLNETSVESIAYPGDWTQLCQKVANATTEILNPN